MSDTDPFGVAAAPTVGSGGVLYGPQGQNEFTGGGGNGWDPRFAPGAPGLISETPNQGGGLLGSGSTFSNLMNQQQAQSNMLQRQQDYAQQYGAQAALKQGFLDAAPDYLNRQLDRQTDTNQIAFDMAQQQYQTRQLQGDYQSGLNRANLDTQNQDVQRGALARQPGYLGQLHSLAQQGYDINRQDIQAQEAQRRRALDSQLTAQGAYGSVLGNQGRYDIQTQAGRDLSNVGLQSQGETARYNENLAQVGDKSKQLDIMSQKTGLDKSDLLRTLQSGLDNLHLSTTTNVKSLLDKMQSSNIQDRVQANDILNKAMQSQSVQYYSQFAPTYPGDQTEPTYSGGGGNRVR